MEVLDLFNIEGEPLGKTIIRGEHTFGEDEYIKIVTVWIKCKNKYLIQRTSEQKHSEYAVSGGHIPTGKTPAQQAVIELDEELGVQINESSLQSLGSIVKGHVIFETYLLEDDSFDTRKMTLQESEVDSVYWLTIDDIEKLINSDEFRPSSALQFNKFIKTNQ